MDKQKFILTISTVLFLVLVLLNLFTVFTPEIGFDALWYHLTLPKLWLMKKQWFIPGGLLYYSVMPRLTETIYIPLISLFGTVGPKALQFFSGIGTFYLVYKISKLMKLNHYFALLSGFTFYITWLVSWQSGSAYIDLFRTFIETLALYHFLQKKWVKGSLLLGLAIGTKWLSLGSLAVYAVVFGPQIIFPALLIASPWFVVAYYFTGNPIYPIFEPFLSHTLPAFRDLLTRTFLSPYYVSRPMDDFITPLAGLFVILAAATFLSSTKESRQTALVGILGTLFSLSLNPPSGRFILPYFPAIVVGASLFISRQSRVVRDYYSYFLVASFVLIIALRSVAFKKYIPYLTGQQTANQFLVGLGEKLPDTFVDTDNYVEQNLENKRILVDKLHNLYYFPYDFDHTSWAPKDKVYDYLVTKGERQENIKGSLLHTNELGIQIYKLDK